ncbi:MAG: pyridoxal phosphate-dependent aminotransferase [Candidatus Dormibacteria bacterium]
MPLRLASRLERLGTESAFEVLAHARALEATGRDIIHLEIGEPDYATPQNIIDVAVKTMNSGATHYTPASGIPEVRAATAAYVSERTGVPGLSAENVVLVPGSKNILHFALLALVEKGDEVIVPDPGYPIYRSLVEFVGGTAVSAPIRQSNDFRLDVAELRSLVTERTRMLIVNSPANPTGGVLTRADCEAIAELAMERDLTVLSDEIYGRMIYEGGHVSLYGVPGMAERTILLDGLSKAWAMCGWRLGFGVMPVELARWMDTLMINSSSCAAAFTQWAAVEAFESAESDAAVAAMVTEFRHRRDVIVDGLNRLPGVRCHRPVGAFYVFPNIEETGWNERDLARTLLDDVGVACLPGTAFGAHGRGHLRFSYANSVANIERALDRLGAHLAAAQPVAAG